VRTGGPPKMSRAARAAFVFWGGPAFAPVRHLRAEVGAPLVREDLSGICRRADGPCRRCRGGGGSRSPRCRRDHRHHPRFGPPALCTCPHPSSVGMGEGKIAAASALRPSLLQSGHPERGSSSLLPEWATTSRPSIFCCSAGPPPSSEVVRTCGGGTGVPFVMAL
jgi:hypothetical protein